MTIEEMHITFRELGQQMGIQTTRAIFSENIDICINFAIDAKTRSILRQNVGTGFPDKVTRDNAKASPINGLYTLYTHGKIEKDNIKGSGNKYEPFSAIIDSTSVYLYTGFDCGYSATDVVHCRLIERELLFDTIDDFCNRPTKRFPIVTVSGNDANLVVDIYTGTTDKAVKPDSIIYTYIRKPATVFLDEDGDEEGNFHSIDCDLPEYLHKDIVTDAINYYLQSLGSKSGDASGQ